MSEVKNNTLDHICIELQEDIIYELILGSSFAESVIKVIDPTVFEDPTHRAIVNLMVRQYKKNGVILYHKDISMYFYDKLTYGQITYENYQKINKVLTHMVTIKESDNIIRDVALSFFKTKHFIKLRDEEKISEKELLKVMVDMFIIDNYCGKMYINTKKTNK